MKKSIISIFLLLPALVFAASKEPSAWTWSLQNIVFIIGVALIIMAFFVMYNVMTGLSSYQQKEWLKAHGVEMPEEIAKNKSILTKLYEKAWSLQPMEKESDIDLGHDYDGIRELDNILPPWWVYLFYGTIIWGAAYIYVSHIRDDAISQDQEYEIAMEEARVEQLAYLAQQANAVDETNVEVLTDAAALNSGKEIYVANCATCHGMGGEGGIGPNMTDEYWIHGGSINDIFKTIKYGVTEKGMIAWKTQLRPASIQKVASYIKSLQGTNPPNPKAAEGELYKEEVTEEAEE